MLNCNPLKWVVVIHIIHIWTCDPQVKHTYFLWHSFIQMAYKHSHTDKLIQMGRDFSSNLEICQQCINSPGGSSVHRRQVQIQIICTWLSFLCTWPACSPWRVILDLLRVWINSVSHRISLSQPMCLMPSNLHHSFHCSHSIFYSKTFIGSVAAYISKSCTVCKDLSRQSPTTYI